MSDQAPPKEASWEETLSEEDRDALENVATIYDAVMAALPDHDDTANILAALTLALKDVALLYHGNLGRAQEASLDALDASFVLEARRHPSMAVH